MSRKSHNLYRIYDKRWFRLKLLYIGRTTNGLNRVQEHMSYQPWGKQITWVRIQRFPDARSLSEAEEQAIKKEDPPYNQIHNDKYRPYVKSLSFLQRVKRFVKWALIIAILVAAAYLIVSTMRPGFDDRLIHQSSNSIR